MERLKLFGIGAIVVALFVVGIKAFTTESPVNQYFGSASGQDHSNLEYFFGGFWRGGRVGTTTSANVNNLVISANEVRQMAAANYVDIFQGRIDQTLTLPASSTVPDLVPRPGDSTSFIIRSATTTATTFRLAAGTGWVIQTASTTPASVASTTAGDYARVTFIRKLSDSLIATSTFGGTVPGDIDVIFEFFK